jgi:phosphoglycerol transferase
MDPKNLARDIIIYFVAVLASFSILAWAMKLWEADLSIPFNYSGDSLFIGSLIKGIIDNGWYLSNPFMGAPFGNHLYDFPLYAYSDFAIIKVISIFSSNYATVMNVFYIATFPLTTLSTLFVLRQFNLSYSISIFGSILYTFVPYHFFRCEDHLLLSAYYTIPLIVMVVIWIYTKDDLFNSKTFGIEIWKAIAICIIISLAFTYYSFFSCFFILIMGISSSIFNKNKKPILISMMLVAVITITTLILVSPTIFYQYENGNSEIVNRNPADSEVYGLKLIQLFLPVHQHRIDFMAEISKNYNTKAPLVNENAVSSLGLMGTLGCILLIFISFSRISGFPNLNSKNLITLNAISILNLSGILMGTIGGLGSIVAFFIYPQIRSYNRISIFIAFYSIFAACIIIEHIMSKLQKRNWQYIGQMALVLLLIVGILDQTPTSFLQPYADTKDQYNSDDKYIKEIESHVPINTLIYQLPYVIYPNDGQLYRMNNYDHLKAYLHSSGLHWSYGTMMGRAEDDWSRSVGNMPVDDMIYEIIAKGFSGIYIDSYGYEDNAKSLITNISKTIQAEPLVSDNGRFYFVYIPHTD